MTTPTPRGRSEPDRTRLSAATAARGVLALASLLALVAGIPVLLLFLARILPVRWPPPSWEQLTTGRDDGSLLLLVLLAVGWAAWAAFTASVAVETVAVVRGLPAPHLPALVLGQRSAATLVTAAAVLFTPTLPLLPAVAAPQPELRVATLDLREAAPAQSTRPAAQRNPAPAAPARDIQQPYPTITVQRYDSYWALAERHLGSGTRYREIVDLNRGLPQPDGRAVRDAETLLPGWILRLPRDARHLPQGAAGGAVTQAPASGPSVTTPPKPEGATAETYVVRRGDTLWDIAHEHLGDPLRFSEIYRLNRGRPQPDGHRLTDPAEIMPGWRLLLPAADRTRAGGPLARPAPPAPRPSPDHTGSAPSSSPPAPSRPPTASPGPGRPDTHAHTGDTSPPSPAAAAGAAADDASAPAGDSPTTPLTHRLPDVNPPAGPGSDAEPVPVGVALPGSAEPVDGGSEAAVPPEANDGGTGLVQSSAPFLVAGLGSLAAAGLVRELQRRRSRQHARRRTGQRIPLPTGATERLERSARSHTQPVTAATLRHALQLLHDGCDAAGRSLPDLRVALVGRDDIRLLLGGDDPHPVAPFVADGPRQWRLPTADPATVGDDPVAAEPPDAADVTTPTPTPTAGDPPSRSGVGPAPFATLLTVGATDTHLVLLNLATARHVTVTGDPDGVASALRAVAVDLSLSDHTSGCRTTFVDCFDDLTAVTADRVEHSTALEHQHGRESPSPTGLPVLVQEHPYGTPPPPHKVLIDAAADDADVHIHVDDNGTATLEPYGIDMEAQRLTAEQYAHVVDALSIAEQDPTPPMPDEPTAEEEREAVLQLLPLDLPAPAATGLKAARATPVLDLTEARAELQPPDGEPALQDELPLLDLRHNAPELPCPRVLLLGPVVVDGTGQLGTPARRRRLTELIAYLALNPDATAAQLDEVMWPNQRVDRNTRNAAVSRARQWLGANPDGQPHLLHRRDGIQTYRLSDEVTVDWSEFQRLARLGLTTDGDQAIAHLDTALALVRGRPFLGIEPDRYSWAEPVINQMIGTIADIAHLAAVAHRRGGRHRQSLHATHVGLTVDASSELLQADLAQCNAVP